MNYETFWEFLLSGYEAQENISEVKLQPNLFRSGDARLPRIAAFLKDIDGFDFMSFGISGTDAAAMPHSARRLIELSFGALRDAGIQTRGQSIEDVS